MAIDQYLYREDPQWWEATAGGEVMRAVRFARNRVHHQWAAAFGEARREGTTDPLSYEAPGFGITARAFAGPSARWYWAGRLPEGSKDSKGENLYRKHLAGQPVRAVLYRLNDLFRQIQPLD